MWKKMMMGAAMSLALIAAGCGSDSEKADAGSSDKKYKITISNSVEEDSALHKGLMEFKEVAEDKSDGRLQVEVFSNGELYASEREAIEAVQAGNIQAVSPATAPLTNFVKEFMALDFLFVFDDVDDANGKLDGELGDILNAKLEENQLKGLGWGSAGMTQMTNNVKPIETIEDFKGMKLRTMENNIHLDSLKELGANPQPYAFGELYSALQQNIFDGMQTTGQLIESSKVYEVQDYMTIMNHSFTAEALVMNKAFYDSLPEDLQKVVDEAGEAFTKHEREVSVEYDAKAMELLGETLKVNTLPEETKQEIIEKLKPVYDKYEKEIGHDLMELIRE
ncbi:MULTISPECIES: TRAP transporter substrate-binding protein [Sporosarcina]|uniref:TRAP transporter substrate-binding protein n=1 Tax=Sporosarcina TaxID=1569 RepID=UPI00129ABB7A|nr:MULTISPECIES: TRAP transporter substrate-binding protein [Sporosarcina]GKV66205.1 C4-dicarboxylate-binding protein DctB [Sporosarcina sp. NCCP-2331]GLB56187.1 C4-dicarboxylate-binding protein DctB [Sporosarcina sp. NCCP-2378]